MLESREPVVEARNLRGGDVPGFEDLLFDVDDLRAERLDDGALRSLALGDLVKVCLLFSQGLLEGLQLVRLGLRRSACGKFFIGFFDFGLQLFYSEVLLGDFFFGLLQTEEFGVQIRVEGFDGLGETEVCRRGRGSLHFGVLQPSLEGVYFGLQRVCLELIGGASLGPALGLFLFQRFLGHETLETAFQLLGFFLERRDLLGQKSGLLFLRGLRGFLRGELLLQVLGPVPERVLGLRGSLALLLRSLELLLEGSLGGLQVFYCFFLAFGARQQADFLFEGRDFGLNLGFFVLALCGGFLHVFLLEQQLALFIGEPRVFCFGGRRGGVEGRDLRLGGDDAVCQALFGGLLVDSVLFESRDFLGEALELRGEQLELSGQGGVLGECLVLLSDLEFGSG